MAFGTAEGPGACDSLLVKLADGPSAALALTPPTKGCTSRLGNSPAPCPVDNHGSNNMAQFEWREITGTLNMPMALRFFGSPIRCGMVREFPNRRTGSFMRELGRLNNSPSLSGPLGQSRM